MFTAGLLIFALPDVVGKRSSSKMFGMKNGLKLLFVIIGNIAQSSIYF
jgi:hypothetical protein